MGGELRVFQSVLGSTVVENTHISFAGLEIVKDFALHSQKVVAKSN